MRAHVKQLIKSLLLCLIILAFGTSTASAEKQEWIDKNYDFHKVKSAFVAITSVRTDLMNGITEKETNEVLYEKAKISGVKIIDFPTMLLLIKADTGVDPLELYKTNQQAALQMIQDGIAQHADIAILIDILDYSYGTQYEEGYIYSTTTNQTSIINGPFGPTIMNTPVPEIHQVPGGNVTTVNVAVRFNAYDAKTRAPIFTRLDYSSREKDKLFDHTNLKKQYGKIVNSYFDALKNKIVLDED